ncbi:MAG: RagB/SusD family nutrient uptake outer membrane protein [Bacteroidetes bacterium]|nr:RagB/SusD family nutrient uptake outer membrane protein [Bacteroidota bacterium]
MQRLYFTLILPALFLISATGCRKFVEITPPANSISTSQVFATDVQASAAMAGVYSELMSNSGSQTWSNGTLTLDAGLSADELSSYQLTSLGGSFGVTPFESAQLSPLDGLADQTFWSPIYKIVNDANFIIDGASASATLSDSARKALVGESKFIRAFCFFYLTNLYGDIPLPLTSDFTKINLLPRSGQDDVYKQIIKDLTDAQSTLPDNYSRGGGQRIIPNKAAATALLARAYLFHKEWKNADDQSTALIGNNQFGLVTDLTKVFMKNSRETIWNLQPNTTVGIYNAYDASNFVPLNVWPQIFAPGDTTYFDPSLFPALAPLLMPTYYLYKSMGNAFEPGDRRKTTWTSYTPTPHYAPYTGDTIFYPYKYLPGPSKAGDSANQYYVVFRLAEQYLIRAEAKTQEGDLAAAAADINTIRARAGLPPTTASDQAGLLTAILRERRVELFAEWGHRFFDLKRSGQANTVLGAMPIKQPWNASQLLYPIPNREIQTDPNLTQNPGY